MDYKKVKSDYRKLKYELSKDSISSIVKLLDEFKYLLRIDPLRREDKDWERIIELFDYNLQTPERKGQVGLGSPPAFKAIFIEKYQLLDKQELEKRLEELNDAYKKIEKKDNKNPKYVEWKDYSNRMMGSLRHYPDDHILKLYHFPSNIMREEIRVVEHLLFDLDQKRDQELLEQKNIISKLNYPIVESINFRPWDYNVIKNKLYLYSTLDWYYPSEDKKVKQVFWSKKPFQLSVVFGIKIVDRKIIDDHWKVQIDNFKIYDLDLYYCYTTENPYDEKIDDEAFGLWNLLYSCKDNGYDMSEIRKFFKIIRDQLKQKIIDNHEEVNKWIKYNLRMVENPNDEKIYLSTGGGWDGYFYFDLNNGIKSRYRKNG